MKLLAATGVIVGVVGLSNVALAQVTGELPPGQQPSATTQTRPPSIISEIEVPFDVIMYIQTEYQGLAVTEVSKGTKNGQPIFRLRVDKDDMANDYESFYLVYDQKWQLLGKDDMVPPPKPKAESSSPAPVATPAPAQTRQTEGGRGSGSPSPPGNTAPAPTPQPTPQPQPEPTPAPEGGGTTPTPN